MRVPSTLILILRLAGSLLFALIGWYVADVVRYESVSPPFNNPVLMHLIMTLGPAILAFILLPRALEKPLNTFGEQVSHASSAQIVACVIGFVVGLLIAALIAIPLALLPDPFRQVLPIACAIILAYLGIIIMNARYREFFAILNITAPANKEEEDKAALAQAQAQEQKAGAAPGQILLDTSVIIDGRIADLCATHFIRETLIVPRFVLNEVQHVADSADPLRRARGRRGLEVLKRLQKEPPCQARIVDVDVDNAHEVDEKLVVLAMQWACPVMTNDYNLNKVATLQGVLVLNINELANALKASVLPGESMTIRIIQEGKETDQGVGYLDDGTMIVVENGRNWIGDHVTVTVTKVLQTAAGRMIFARRSGDKSGIGS